MTTPVFTNNAETTVAVTTTASATTIEVVNASVFNVLIQDGAGATNNVHEMATLIDGTNIEVVKVTNAATGTNIITVVRAQEGTAGYAFLAGDTIEGRLTAQELTNGFFGRAPNDYSAIYGVDSVDLVTNRSTSSHGATGLRSFAGGYRAQASATDTFSWGLNSIASASNAMAFGSSTTATGTDAAAFAYSADATGNYSFAAATGAQALADYTTAVGSGATADQINASAYGEGAKAKATYCLAMGTDSYNYVSKTHNITGMSLIAKDWIHTDETLHYAGQENIVFSLEYNFESTAADNVVTIEIPTGSTFFVSEVGFIPTSVSAVTTDPTIEFGSATTTDAILTATATTTQTAKKRERYENDATNWVADADNVGHVSQLTVSVTVAAVATTFLARVYFKGMLVEDE